MELDTKIELSSYYENFIKREVESGKYSSTTEVINSALRLLELDLKKSSFLIDELVLGENSPQIHDFNSDSHLQSLHDKYSK
jgi:antitoxin ParD1/3/4